jgi:DNA invertase Pin-like site-specific DNA recombinase
MLLGYARISTGEQSIDLQRDALTAAGCERIFADVASGSKTDRPGLARLLENARPGDTLVVWRLDRLGRSLMHLLSTIEDLHSKGIEFRSITEAMDTSTNNGKLIFHIFAAIAEFERNLIRERVNAGLRAMRKRGGSSGRRTVMTPDKVKLLRELDQSGEYTRDQMAVMLEVSRPTVFRMLRSTKNT